MNYTINEMDFEENDQLDAMAELIIKQGLEVYFPIPPSTKEFFITALKTPSKYFTRKRFLIKYEPDSIFVGFGHFTRFHEHNLNHASVTAYIVPDHRAKGIFHYLIKTIIKYLPEEITTIETFVRYKDGEKNTSFHILNDKGWKEAYRERMSGSDLTQFDPAQVKLWAKEQFAKVKARGFSLIEFTDYKIETTSLNPNQFCAMVENIRALMPTEDLEIDNEVYSVKNFEEERMRFNKFGMESIFVVAVHDETGEIAGYTCSLFEPKSNPDVVGQNDTGVIKKYWGNGLGLALKLKSLEYIKHHRTGKTAKMWSTGNAGSNAAMIRINTQLGYQELFFEVGFQVSRMKFEEMYLVG